jgi:hypothetical protein
MFLESFQQKIGRRRSVWTAVGLVTDWRPDSERNQKQFSRCERKEKHHGEGFVLSCGVACETRQVSHPP